MNNSPKQTQKYYIPTRCNTTEKTHRKQMSTTSELPFSSLNNNFDIHKNFSQKQFYNQEFYRSRSTLLNLTQKKFEINNQYIFLNNRINLIQKKNQISQQRCGLKTNHIKTFLDKQRSKSEFFREKERV